jgi:hypothetical protein
MKCAVAIDTIGTLENGEWVFELDTVKESDKAICYNLSGNGVWFPKSQITETGINSRGGWVIIPVWLAKEKGIFTGSVIVS